MLAAEDSVVNNIYNLEISSVEYDRLVNLGFSEDEIIKMDPEEYSLNKNLKGEIVAEDKKFIKLVEYHEGVGGVSTLSNNVGVNRVIPKADASTEFSQFELTEEQFNHEVEQAQKQSNNTFILNEASILATPGYDDYSTSYKVITTTIVSLGSKKYRVKNNVFWKVMPSNRDFDLIGVAVGNNWAGNKGTEYAKQTWNMYNYNNGSVTSDFATYSTSQNASYWDLRGEGYAVKMNLKDDDWIALPGAGLMGYSVSTTDMYMYYTVSPTLTSVARIDAFGRYAHAITTIKPTVGFSVSTALSAGFSISINKQSDFEYSNHTQATITF